MIREEDVGTVFAGHKIFCERWDIDYPLHSSCIRGKRTNFRWLADPEIAKSFLQELEELLLTLPIICICLCRPPARLCRALQGSLW